MYYCVCYIILKLGIERIIKVTIGLLKILIQPRILVKRTFFIENTRI